MPQLSSSVWNSVNQQLNGDSHAVLIYAGLAWRRGQHSKLKFEVS